MSALEDKPEDQGVTRREAVLFGAQAAVALTVTKGRHKRTHLPFKHKRHVGSIKDIEHVVILMQENRSFDHYFGTLPGVRGFDDPNAMTLANGRSVFHQPGLYSVNGYTLPFHYDTTTTNAQCTVGTSHSWESEHAYWDGGRMTGWLQASEYFSMGYFKRADIPWHYAFADAFTICDAYHCSVMGPTNPNRYMMWTGTIDPHGRNGGPAIDNSGSGYTWATYPERLTKAGISWRVYHEEDDFDDNILKFFKQYQTAPKTSPLYKNAMVNLPKGAFEEDAAAGKLPQVSWLVAPTIDSEHPDGEPARGARYINSALQALGDNPDLWAKTAFILTYDENDGLFDHVLPPVAPDNTPDEWVQGLPVGLSFRVPTIVASPWSRGGYVCSETFDHTSLLRFLEKRFGVMEPQISAWRRKTCGDLTSAFDFSNHDAEFPNLPPTGRLLTLAEQQCERNLIPLPPLLDQKMPHQEKGDKPQRPIRAGRSRV